MTYLFKLAQRTARLRVLPLIGLGLALAGCDTDRLTNGSESPNTTPATESSTPTALFSTSFRGGIPFGMYNQPTDYYGGIYNGGTLVPGAGGILSELAEIKSRGGKAVLGLVGNESNYIGSDGHFSYTLWKQRIDRFKSVNFSSYIDDGTIIANLVIDEPNDPDNWNGVPVPPSMVEQLATYSKSLWPNMPTVVRVDPSYLLSWSGYRNLDAAWSQWLPRKGDPSDYLRQQIASAQKAGVALITGMNTRKGGPDLTPLSATTVQQAGTALLSFDYPCAFLMWEYDANYLARSDIKSAMSNLSQKAAAHSNRSCGGGGSTDGGGTTDGGGSTPLPGVSGIALKAVKDVADGVTFARLTWQGAASSSVRLYVNTVLRRTTDNDGRGRVTLKNSGTYTFKICEVGSTRCSNNASVTK